MSTGKSLQLSLFFASGNAILLKSEQIRYFILALLSNRAYTVLTLPATCCRCYFNPKATGKQIIKVSRYAIVIFGLFMGCLAIILFVIGLSLGWGE